MFQKLKSLPFKKLFKWSFILLTILVLSIGISNYWIIKSTKAQLYSDKSLIPQNDVAILLGASKTLRNGSENLFFNTNFKNDLRFQLLDVVGREQNISIQKIVEGNYIIHMKTFSAGIYILNVINEEGNYFSRKIIKVK